MAFGDKLPELPMPVYTFKNVNVVVENIAIEFTPAPPKRTVPEAVACCNDSFNFYVEHGTGIPFCLKCRKTMTKEHFNKVLDAYAERMKASR